MAISLGSSRDQENDPGPEDRAAKPLDGSEGKALNLRMRRLPSGAPKGNPMPLGPAEFEIGARGRLTTLLETQKNRKSKHFEKNPEPSACAGFPEP